MEYQLMGVIGLSRFAYLFKLGLDRPQIYSGLLPRDILLSLDRTAFFLRWTDLRAAALYFASPYENQCCSAILRDLKVSPGKPAQVCVLRPDQHDGCP